MQVELLFQRGNANGVQDLAILTGDEVRKMEPAVTSAYSALWSPNTGVVDYGLVTASLAKDVLATGRADIKLQFEAQKFTVTDDKRVVIQGVEPGQVWRVWVCLFVFHACAVIVVL